MKRSILIPLLLFCLIADAQNLVPNPGFESVAPCPNGLSQLGTAFPWARPSGSTTTPDVFNSCNTVTGSPSCPVDVPLNFGGNVPALSGNGYAGIICYYESTANLREYLVITLSSSLVKGAGYRIEFNAHKAPDCKYSIDKVAMVLSTSPLSQIGSDPITMPTTVESQGTVGPSWTLISTNYIASGGERYLTIGNFRNDAITNFTNNGSSMTGCLLADAGAYYFIDDVLVEQLPENMDLEGDTVICIGDNAVLNANSNVNVWWAEENTPNDTFALGPSIVVSPLSTTSYIANGVLLKDTIKVRVIDPPLVFLGPDTAVCDGKQLSFDATNPDATYQWSTGSTDAIEQVSGSGLYWVAVTNDGCVRSDTVLVDIKSNPLVDLGDDSVVCAIYGDTIVLDAGIAVNYIWYSDSTADRYLTANEPGPLAVQVEYANGCKNSGKINIIEYCPEVLWIPNSFSPNGDGKNELYRVYGNNISTFDMKVFNRFGSLVFHTEKLNGSWDGMIKGGEAPSGVYIYHILFSAITDQGRINYAEKKGTIHLIR